VTLMEMVAPALTGVADVPGDPAALRATALTYTAVADTVEAAANHQAAALGTVPTGWSGRAALAYKAMAAARLARARNASGAFREAAGALSAYANDLETAQGLAREARATATIVRDDAARLDADAPTSEFLAPGPGDRPADVWGQELLAYARDASSRSTAAAEQARAAAMRAAAAFDRLAALAPAPAAAPGAAAGGSPPGAGQPADPGGSWWQGALRQLGSFLDGGRDAIVDPFVDAYRLTPLADGWQDQWKQISAGMEHLAIHPDELPGVLLGLDDLREDGVAHWLGGLAPDAIAMVLSGGVAAALRARKVPDALDVADGARRLDNLGDAADVDLAAETERVVDLSDLATERHRAPDDSTNWEDAENWGRQEYDAMMGALPEPHKGVVWDYSANGFVEINQNLRGLPEGPIQPEIQEKIRLLDEVLATKPIPEDIVVYRKTWPKDLDVDLRDPVGEILEERGYMSTSLGEALQDHRTVELRLRVPAGTPGAYIGSLSAHSYESEVLLGRGLRYEITGVSTATNFFGRPVTLLDATILPTG
jgi:ADP-ribosyltransferase exoenzyme